MKKLNMQGISHLLIPIVVVVAVAAVGTFMLVASHADTETSNRSIGLASDLGHAQVKRVIHNGNSKVVTDLKLRLHVTGQSSYHISKVTIGGVKANSSQCSYNECDFSVRVNGNHAGEHYMTKVYQGKKGVTYALNVKYN